MNKNGFGHRRLLRAAFHAGAVVALGGALSASNACTIFVNHDAHQCETTDDCARFAGTVCSDRHVCVLGETACLDNSTCIDRYGSETYYCKKDILGGLNTGKPLSYSEAGTCQNLLSKQCTQLLASPGDLRNDDAVILGLHLMPSWFPIIKGGVDAAEMARKDFKDVAGGLPGIHGKSSPRPVVFISCDVPFGDQPQNHDVADHLIDVGIPASIGPLPPEWMAYYLGRSTALETKTARGGPMFFTTGNKFPNFDAIPGTAGLFFSVGLASDIRAHIYARLLTYQEDQLRKTGFSGDAKVAFISPGDTVDFVVEQEFSKVGKWNNKSVADNTSAKLYQQFGWGDTNSTTDPGYVKAMNDVVAFNPDFVICDGGALCANVTQFIETAITAAGKTSNVYYVLGQEAEQAPLYDFVGTNEALRKRVLGARPGRNEQDERWALVKSRILQTFNDPAAAQGFAIAAYDLAYEIQYAAAAVGDEPLTGQGMGRAIMTRFKKGGFPSHTYEAGLGIVKTLQALQSGQNIEIDGAGSEAIYREDGTVSQGAQIWCIMKSSLTKPGDNRFTDSGYFYDVDSDSLKVWEKGVNTTCM